jgi:hypothetical protein
MKSLLIRYFDLLRYDKNGNRIETLWFVKPKNKKKNRKKKNG